MSDSLARRVGRIVSGSVHRLIDSIESAAPEAVMEQTIREVDRAIEDVRTELGLQTANRHQANKKLMAENRKHVELAEQIELALREKRDELAEAGIAKQLDIEAQIPVLEELIAECGEREKELSGYLLALQARRREMCEEFEAQRKARVHAEVVSSRPDDRITGSLDKAGAALIAFNRVSQGVLRLPQGEESVHSSQALRLAELEQVARKNRIDERLAHLRTTLLSKE